MRNLFVLVLLSFLPILLNAQKFFSTIPVKGTVNDDLYLLTVENSIWKKFTIRTLKKDVTPKVNVQSINYIPSTAGNLLNTNEFVVDPNTDFWFIDYEGNATRIINVVKHNNTLTGSGTNNSPLEVNTDVIATKSFVENEVKIDSIIAGENVTIDYTNPQEPVISVVEEPGVEYISPGFNLQTLQGAPGLLLRAGETPIFRLDKSGNQHDTDIDGLKMVSWRYPSNSDVGYGFIGLSLDNNDPYGSMYINSYESPINIGNNNIQFSLSNSRANLFDFRDQNRDGLRLWGYGENTDGIGGDYSNLAKNAFAPVGLAIQSLSVSGNTLSISGGNSVTIPSTGSGSGISGLVTNTIPFANSSTSISSSSIIRREINEYSIGAYNIGTSLEPVLALSASGNAVGSTNGNMPLLVDARTSQTILTSTNQAILITNSNDTNNNWAKFSFGTGVSNSVSASVACQFINRSAAAGRLSFSTRKAGGALSERMTIESDGEVNVKKNLVIGNIIIDGSSPVGNTTTGFALIKNSQGKYAETNISKDAAFAYSLSSSTYSPTPTGSQVAITTLPVNDIVTLSSNNVSPIDAATKKYAVSYTVVHSSAIAHRPSFVLRLGTAQQTFSKTEETVQVNQYVTTTSAEIPLNLNSTSNLNILLKSEDAAGAADITIHRVVITIKEI